MNKIRKNNMGFTIVELLLVIIILILLGFVGWYIYHTNHKTTTPTTTSNVKSTSTSTSIKYFTITQWGIRAPYNGSLTLEYSTPTGSDPSYINLSSAQLDASDPSCQSSGNYGGAFEQYVSTDIVSLEDGTSSGQTPAEYIASGGFGGLNGGKYAQIGNYYYFYVQPQGVCSSSQSSQNIQTQTTNAFESIVQNLKAIPGS
jgi:hypothetical protein